MAQYKSNYTAYLNLLRNEDQLGEAVCQVPCNRSYEPSCGSSATAASVLNHCAMSLSQVQRRWIHVSSIKRHAKLPSIVLGQLLFPLAMIEGSYFVHKPC